ncbi:hypothetical protein [Flavobacterium tructae]|uniref:hypothetical protein n=1 Tax=Flavobacterium tructae TaxID=1114873 RepID=UPI0035A84C5D
MEMIKRKTIILSVLIVCIFFFEKCNFYDSNISSTIVNHQIIYDSINYKVKNFSVNLYTTLEFENKNIERNQYNNFLLIIKKDTFPLIPEVNYLKKESHNQIQIRYLSKINFQSNRYDNDSILNIIKKYSKVINSKGEEINKKKEFTIEPLILLHMPKNNGIKI